MKKLETVSVTGLKLSKLAAISSALDDQLERLSYVVLRRSSDPRRDHEPDPVSAFRRNWSKLLVLLLRSNNFKDSYCISKDL